MWTTRATTAAPATRSMLLVVSILLAWAGCSTSAPVEVRMDLAVDRDFYSSPFPSAVRETIGELDVASFPNPKDNPLVSRVLELAEEMDGFGLTSAVYFSLSGPLQEGFRLDVLEAHLDDAPVALVPLEADVLPSPRSRHPIDVHYQADGGPYGGPHLLSLLPVQGIPLAPETEYIGVVTNALTDREGRPLVASETIRRLRAGERPAGMTEATHELYNGALDRLSDLGISRRQVVGMTVFRTGNPAQALRTVVEAARAEGPLELKQAPHLTDAFDDYCVFESTLEVPVYQEGSPPYATGGGFVFDEGLPILQRREEARVVITVPRHPPGTAGFPVVLFSRTGAGGERPLVDRGPHQEAGGPSEERGAGPARIFAQAGFAGVSVDGPHGGLRNVTGGDEQFLVFNFQNPRALRDNIRQSALELVLEADLLRDFTFDAGACEGAPPVVSFDISRLTLMGHSMGATIAPLALGVGSDFRAAVLTGAGGSWIENIIYKQSPLPTRRLTEVLLQYPDDHSLHRHDPFLNLMQWVAEAADPPVYAAQLPQREQRPHILTIQGVVDTYILPPIANVTSLSFGLDLGGEALDQQDENFRSLTELLPLTNARAIQLPAIANAPDGTTQVVVQHQEDGIENGHEVGFQVEGARNQIRCFLESLSHGGPPTVVDKGGKLSEPCGAP